LFQRVTPAFIEDSVRMGRIERQREIARRRARREKLKKLRGRFAAAKTEADRAAIRTKVQRLSPFVVLEK
jgi:hypothetical protein